MKARDLAKLLGRSEESLKKQIYYRGLKKMITEQQRRRILELAKTTNFSGEQIAKEVGKSSGTVLRVLHQYGIHRGPRGKQSQFELLKGFNGNKINDSNGSKTRDSLIYAYRRTCWDCKRTFVADADLQVHHDFTRLPVQVVVLCKGCHSKRHGRKIA